VLNACRVAANNLSRLHVNGVQASVTVVEST